jgi:hypothetical protein
VHDRSVPAAVGATDLAPRTRSVAALRLMRQVGAVRIRVAPLLEATATGTALAVGHAQVDVVLPCRLGTADIVAGTVMGTIAYERRLTARSGRHALMRALAADAALLPRVTERRPTREARGCVITGPGRIRGISRRTGPVRSATIGRSDRSGRPPVTIAPSMTCSVTALTAAAVGLTRRCRRSQKRGARRTVGAALGRDRNIQLQDVPVQQRDIVVARRVRPAHFAAVLPFRLMCVAPDATFTTREPARDRGCRAAEHPRTAASSRATSSEPRCCWRCTGAVP